MTAFKGVFKKLCILTIAQAVIVGGLRFVNNYDSSASGSTGAESLLVSFSESLVPTASARTKDSCGGSADEFYEAQKRDLMQSAKYPSVEFEDFDRAKPKIRHDKDCMYYIESYVSHKRGVGLYDIHAYYALYKKTDQGYQRMGLWEKQQYRTYHEMLAAMMVSVWEPMQEVGLNALSKPSESAGTLDVIKSTKKGPIDFKLMVERPFNTVLGFTLKFSSENYPEDVVQKDYDVAYKLIVEAMRSIRPIDLSVSDQKTLQYYLHEIVQKRRVNGLPGASQTFILADFKIYLEYVLKGDDFSFYIGVNRNDFDD